jgi:RNA polymerase sigma factor (sigma-70 family)
LTETLRQIEHVREELEARFPGQADLRQIASHLSMATAKVEQAIVAGQSVLRLDDDQDDELLSEVGEGPAIGPEEVLVQKDIRTCVTAALAELTSREVEVLTLRFGLGDGEPHTLSEVGEKFMLSRERIRQIERKAFEKLRYSPHVVGLRSFVAPAIRDSQTNVIAPALALKLVPGLAVPILIQPALIGMNVHTVADLLAVDFASLRDTDRIDTEKVVQIWRFRESVAALVSASAANDQDQHDDT